MGDYIEYNGQRADAASQRDPHSAFRHPAGEGTPQTYVMLWIVERFDVATDTAATIARILADFRPPMVSGQADADTISSELATTWSKALTTDAVRQALARNLSTITQVPDGLPTHDLEELDRSSGISGPTSPTAPTTPRGRSRRARSPRA